MLIELGRQIPKQPHPKAMHARFHARDANAVRENQSMKAGRALSYPCAQPGLSDFTNFGRGYLIQRFFNPVSLASAAVFVQPCRFTELLHRLVQMIRTDCAEARYCRVVKKERTIARAERRVGQHPSSSLGARSWCRLQDNWQSTSRAASGGLLPSEACSCDSVQLLHNSRLFDFGSAPG